MKKNYFIFDVDGTLVDTKFQNIESFKKVMAKNTKVEVGEDALRMASGLPGKETLRRLNIENVDKVYEDWADEMAKLDYTVKLYDGVVELLSFLKKKSYKLGIVTSRTESEIKVDKVLMSIIDYFDTVVEVSDGLKSKPNPDQLLKAIKCLNADKESAVYIGDTLYDYQCAKNAGVDFRLACWGYKDDEKEALLSGLPNLKSYNSPYEAIEEFQNQR